jgi:NADPH-dependent 2,4-dienoyl-CoA reductase/sulfur reductase-like enzyme
MTSQSNWEFDVLVVGAGPAGIAAAVCAAECGLRVGLVDDNRGVGGQIWRGAKEARFRPEEQKWFERLRAVQIATFLGYRIIDHVERGALVAETSDDVRELRYAQLILATGARERFLPFPGWTLPNVIGAGGIQTLAKSGLPIHGKRIVVAGTGPLLLAVADYLHQHGAEIPLICEQTSRAALLRFSFALFGQTQKIIQAAQLWWRLAGVQFVPNTWPVAAHGEQKVESVTISRQSKLQTIACDYLACGFHLVPNTELASLLGCEMVHGFVRVDDFQRTTIPNVFCAGEPTGIGGVEMALLEGQIAGLSAGGRPEEARHQFAARAKQRKFAAELENAFRLRSELRGIVPPETLVCRCEDVSYSRLRSYGSWRAAKLQTRCGMGACQGRVCGPATQFLLNWNPDSVRPPVFPARVESLAAFANCPEAAPTMVTGGH